MCRHAGGLGGRLDALHAFQIERGIESRLGNGRPDQEGRGFIRRCFADRATAEAVMTQFGGTPVVPPMPKDPLALVQWGRRYIQGD